MKIVHGVEEIKLLITETRKNGKTIGFIPTMGYLHEGHLTLMRQAKQENDWVVASIFVNPLQFGPGEDYAVYPRDLTRDAQMAAAAGVDVLFAPGVADMYPDGYEKMQAYVDMGGVTTGLCGASRPGHFRGVATVVNKLFHIVEPDVAYFGQKDAQQVAVIRCMIRDLNMRIRLVSVPIVRDTDGLALSSRNVYLSADERRAALVLSQSLRWAESQLESGEKNSDFLVQGVQEQLMREPLVSIEYVAAVDVDSMTKLSRVQKPFLLALAVQIGKTRLIDNLLWEG